MSQSRSLFRIAAMIAVLASALCLCLAAPARCAQRPASAKEMNAPVLGWVEIEPVANQPAHVAIVGRILGLRETEGRFTLEVIRHDGGSVSNSSQSGTFKVRPGESLALSRSATNLSPSTSLIITLKVFIGEREVFTSVLKPSQ